MPEDDGNKPFVYIIYRSVIGRCKSRDHKRHAEDDGEQAAWNVEVEEKRQRVDGEERKPAADERSHHDAENERGPPLASTSQLPLGSQYKTRGEMIQQDRCQH